MGLFLKKNLMAIDHYQYATRIYINGNYAGSGFLATPNHILTNAHVIGDNKEVDIRVVIPSLMDNQLIKVTIDSIVAAIDIDIVCLSLPYPVPIKEFPILVTYKNEDIVDQSCSVFVNQSNRNYGHTQAVIRQPVNSFLFQGNRTDNSLEIDYGHSGSAVWLSNSVIGIVCRADGQGVFNFVPSSLIIDRWPTYNSKPLNAQVLFDLPVGYIRRKHDYQRIINTLLNPQEDIYRMLVITGPSGIGKSKLIIDVYQQLPDVLNKKVRIVSGLALRSYQNIISTVEGLNDGDILIIDDIKEGDQVIESGWLKRELQQKLNIILVTAAKDYLINRIDKHLKFDQRKIYHIAIAEMREEEAIEILKSISSKQLNESQKTTIVREVCGYPMLLTILCEIFEQQEDEQIELYESIFLPQTSNSSIQIRYEGLSKRIVENWLNQSKIKVLNKDVVILLSGLSVIGLTPQTLKSILNCSEIDLTMSLRLLREKGLIYLIIAPDRREQLVVIHDLLKKIIASIENGDKKILEQQYLEYVKFTACQHTPSDCELVMQIDALVLQMRTLWEMAKNNNIEINHFYQQMIVFSRELDRFLPIYSNGDQKSAWIADLFSSYISADCKMLIPLARAIKNLQPNTTLAEMMWQGTKNIFDPLHPDALARSCCITAAFRHWKAMGTTPDRTVNLAKQHLQNIYNFYRKGKQTNDHEIAALVGGICAMGEYTDALRIIEDKDYSRYFPKSQITIVVYLLSLWDLWERNGKNQKLELMLKQVASEKSHLIREGQAKKMTFAFLQSHGFSNIESPRTCDGEEFSFATETAGTVGQMAHNRPFMLFLQRQGLGNSWV
jgi:trypsin-like peptidase